MLARAHGYDQDMQLIWNASIRDTWDHFENTQPRLLEQSWAYGQAMQAQGLGVQRAQILIDGACAAQAQFITRRVLGYIGLATCSRGPIWSAQLSAQQRAQALKWLKRSIPIRPWRATLFSPSAADPHFSPADTGRLTQVITGDSTALVDLRQSEAQLRANLHGKWRNHLRQAEQHPLQVFCGTDTQRLATLLQHEAQQRRDKHFYGLPIEFVESFVACAPHSEDAYWLCEASVEDEPLAAMLFLRHGNTATYHIGWLDPRARSMNVHNLLLWRGLCDLKKQGVDWLDLGGVNTEGLAGISHFKLRVGGEKITHPGTFF